MRHLHIVRLQHHGQDWNALAFSAHYRIRPHSFLPSPPYLSTTNDEALLNPAPLDPSSPPASLSLPRTPGSVNWTITASFRDRGVIKGNPPPLSHPSESQTDSRETIPPLRLSRLFSVLFPRLFPSLPLVFYSTHFPRRCFPPPVCLGSLRLGKNQTEKKHRI